jgi:hypothetical protein
MMAAEFTIVVRTKLIADALRNFGSVRIRVQGSSMLPSIRPGDEIEIRAARFDDLDAGGVIAYLRAGRLFVHRLVERDTQQLLVTRGDTLPQADAPVSESELLGSVAAVFRNGKKIKLRPSLAHRTGAALFRRSQLCAALFVKFASL